MAYAGSLLLLMSLAFYGQWVISGVVEEKNNRVVELILSAVRPHHLLAGKVIGIGLLGFGQLALVAGLAAGLLVAGVFDAPAELGGDMALVIPWFALGFALYAVAYAVAGALASSQQNPDTAGQPVTYTLLAVYFAGYVALSVDPEGLLASVLTVFPLSAPLVLPARSASSECRSGSTRLRSPSSSARSTRSSASRAASTASASSTAAPLWASARPGGSPGTPSPARLGLAASRRRALRGLASRFDALGELDPGFDRPPNRAGSCNLVETLELRVA